MLLCQVWVQQRAHGGDAQAALKPGKRGHLRLQVLLQVVEILQVVKVVEVVEAVDGVVEAGQPGAWTGSAVAGSHSGGGRDGRRRRWGRRHPTCWGEKRRLVQPRGGTH